MARRYGAWCPVLRPPPGIMAATAFGITVLNALLIVTVMCLIAAWLAPTVWCSWYRYFEQVTAQDVRTDLAALDAHELPVDVVQRIVARLTGPETPTHDSPEALQETL